MKHSYEYIGDTATTLFVEDKEYNVSKENNHIEMEIKLPERIMEKLRLKYKGDTT
jgi:hypothetical protein